MGAGFGISRATDYRYRYKILDGKLIDADRCQASTISRTGEQRGRWLRDR